MYSDPLATFVTTTSFGSWLPGDVRGYVDHGEMLPPRPLLNSHVRRQMTQPMVVFSRGDQDLLFDSLSAAALEFGYRLTDAVVEATHLHWVIRHDDDVPTMVGRLKNRMRQRLDRGRIWTADYSHRLLFKDDELYNARNYLTKHAGLRLLAGRLIRKSATSQSTGGAGGFHQRSGG
jgi:hypothetical protein